MSATADRPAVALGGGAPRPLARANGLQLLGEVDGSGYRERAALVRRADGQMVQLGPLMYALLEEIDGRRDAGELAAAVCEKLGRACDEEHVVAIADKLAEQGLLAGSEANAPERANPLLALRWKVLVTDPAVTRRLTAPFTVLFRPWIMLPVLAAFLVVCWFVLVQKGVASAAAQAFDKPELILAVFALGVASAAFHEIGHASACRYGGGTPGGMGAGIYLVWPAFYTDVTDAYRLPRRARLRTDLGGLYFNAIVAVATLAAWAALRVDVLLLLIGLQLLEMVKQLSPVIRADGYHILSDVTGVPDLYAHIVPTMQRLLPGRRGGGAALTGRARVIVTLWVLVIVPVMLSLLLSAVLLLPRLAASTWVSGSHVLSAIPDLAAHGHVIDLLVAILRLFALTLPVVGAALIVRRLLLGVGGRAVGWSRGRPARQVFVVVLAGGVACAASWAWWPAGQYRPIRATDRGTVAQVGQLVASRSAAPAQPHGSRSSARTQHAPQAAAPVVRPGTHLAISLIPRGGATKAQPAIFVITDPTHHDAPVVIASSSSPASSDAQAGSPTTRPPTTTATAFTFNLPKAPRPGDSQALAVNRTDGGTTYDIAYSLVTVHDGAAVDQRNGAYAFANCRACTTVAVSFQVVLVVGNSRTITPINVAEALNGNCPSCVTTAIADQIVVSVASDPSPELLARLDAELQRLDAIGALGAGATPADIAAHVDAVTQGINQVLADSGIVPRSQDSGSAAVNPPPDGTSTTSAPGDATTSTTPSGDPATAGTSNGTSSTPPTTDPPAAAGSTDPSTTTSTTPTTTTSTTPTTTSTTSTTPTTPTP